jgi:TolB protein
VSTLAWLGDGSGLLYNGSVHDHADLWTMRAGGEAQRRLTNTGELISAPAWSSDGTQLAYGSSALKGGLCGYCGGSIALAGPDGRKRALVPGSTPGQESEDTNAAWSPSGTQLAVSNAFNGGVWVVGLDGSGRAQIAPDGSGAPAWSPDGTTVAYASSFGGGVIFGVDPTGAKRRRLLPASSLKARSLAWSPDGRQLAFSTAHAIYVGAADGSAPPVLVTSATAPGRVSFSPDGQWLAFAAQTGTVHPYSAIYTVAVDGSRLRQLTTGPFDSADPAWRPA